MNKYTIAIIILLYLIVGCGKKDDEQAAKIDRKVSAFKNVEQIRTEDNFDFREIEEIYNSRLQAFALKYDKVLGEEMNVIIEKAIRDGKVSKYPKVQAQIISKTLQKIFFLALQDELEQSRKLDNTAATHQGNASGYYEAIRPTALRRGDWLGVDTLYDEEIQQVFGKAKEAIEKKDSEKFVSQKKILTDKLMRIFALSVLYEVEGMVENRAIYEQFQIKQAEASTYYKTIEEEVKKNNPSGHEIIHYQLNVNPEYADFEAIKKELEVGVAIKID